MGEKTVGIAVSSPDAATALADVCRAEELGIPAVWSTSVGCGGDALTFFAAAAARTERILLGTSILQTWSRHPVTVGQQAHVIAGLAPGRFRLGVGPGHKDMMIRTFGADFRAPLGHLREYMRILKALLGTGSVDFDGEYYTAHARNPGPVDVPVMASALQRGSYELCGAESDGAISWVSPFPYLRDVALPALREGADKAGRPTPPLIVHAPVCVNEDLDAVRAAVSKQFGHFADTAFYGRMFAAAGFPNSAKTGWTDGISDSGAIIGDEATVARGIEEVFGWGASEIVASVVTVGDSPRDSWERTVKLLAQVSG